MISRKDIEKLALADPAIFKAVQLYHAGHCGWDEAMMTLVEWFSKERKTMMDMLLDAKLKAPAPVMLVVPREEQ